MAVAIDEAPTAALCVGPVPVTSDRSDERSAGEAPVGTTSFYPEARQDQAGTRDALKIRILQPATPPYRTKLWNTLGSHRGRARLDVTVYADEVDGMTGAASDTSQAVGFRPRNVLRGRLMGTGRRLAVWYRGWPWALGDCDVVVVPGNPRILNLIPQVLLARARGIPVIWFGQGFAANSRSHLARIRIAMMRSTLLSHIVLYTSREKEQFLAMGFPEDRVTALDNGIDVDEIDRISAQWTAERREAFARQHALGGRRWIAYIGRLREQCGFELLPQVLALLPEDVGLIVVGDGEARATYERQLHDAGLAGRVRWAGALFDEQEIAPWMLSAQCMVYPGSTGLSTIHALAYRLPVVLHDSEFRHRPEFAALRPGVNGATFPYPGSAAEVAGAIRSIIDDPVVQHRMSRAAHDTVATAFNIRSMSARFAAAIERVAGLTEPAMRGEPRPVLSKGGRDR